MAHTFHLASTIGDRQVRSGYCSTHARSDSGPADLQRYSSIICTSHASRGTLRCAWFRLGHRCAVPYSPVLSSPQLTEPGNAEAAAYLYDHAQQLSHLAQNRADLSATVRHSSPFHSLPLAFSRQSATVSK